MADTVENRKKIDTDKDGVITEEELKAFEAHGWTPEYQGDHGKKTQDGKTV
jgi:hypothetical protein